MEGGGIADPAACVSGSIPVSPETGRASDAAAPLHKAMDWPMSREEKRSQLIRLYNHDVQAADRMLQSGEQALEALQAELDAIRHASGDRRKASQTGKAEGAHGVCTDSVTSFGLDQSILVGDPADESKRLRQAVESAAAVLRAILHSDAKDELEAADRLEEPQRPRSEGCRYVSTGTPLRSALSRTPRSSRTGTPKRRVSFSDINILVDEKVPPTAATCNSDQQCSQTPSPPCGAEGSPRESACPRGRESSVDFDEGEPEPEEPRSVAEHREAAGANRSHSHRSSGAVGDCEADCVVKTQPQDCADACEYVSKMEMWVPASVAKIGLHIKLYDTLPQEVRVNSVTEGTWADRQGVRIGDVLIAVGGRVLGGLSRAAFVNLIQERPLHVVIHRPMVD